MQTALARHDAIMRQSIGANGGHVFKTVGDAFYAAFGEPAAAARAAVAAQRLLLHEHWAEMPPLRVRMALHTGEADARDGDYFGPPLNRVARLLAVAHGGQILLSGTVWALLRDNPPHGATAYDLGEHRLRDIAQTEHIWQLHTPDLPSVFPPLPTFGNNPNNLPAQATSFVGRDTELVALRDLLARPDVRLVTLTGPGGTGKTRLSLKIGADSLSAFANGVYFVSLASVADPTRVVAAIAAAMGVKETNSTPIIENLKTFLRDKKLLLIVDNFEQVVVAAPVLSEILEAAPGVKMLVSSRIVLHIYGEHEFAVQPLALPDPADLPPLDQLADYPAITLFVERARAARPDFGLTADNARAVVEICVRLDGLPLAIELAAARSKIFSPQAMLERLSGARTQSLQLLTGGARNLPARQQTLRGAIAWSYDLLDPNEKRLFARLGVFVGGCTADAADAVCNPDGGITGDILENMVGLAERSLVRQEFLAGGDNEIRFTMLETIREFALERLRDDEELDATRLHHAAYYINLAETANTGLRGAEQEHWRHILRHEHPNLRVAIGAAIERGDATTALRLCGALWWFWHLRGHHREGQTWLTRALAMNGATDVRLRARAQTGLAFIVWVLTDYATLLPLALESVELARQSGDGRVLAEALSILSNALMVQGNYIAARAQGEEAVRVARSLNDTWYLAWTTNNVGYVTRTHGTYEVARQYFSQALNLFRQVGDQYGLAEALYHMGIVAHSTSDVATARTLYDESIARYRELGTPWALSWALISAGELARAEGDDALAMAYYTESGAVFEAQGQKKGIAVVKHNMGYVAQHQGDNRLASDLFRESLLACVELENRRGIAECLIGLAGVAARADMPVRAARLFGAGDHLFRVIDAGLEAADRREYTANIIYARSLIGADAWAVAYAAGVALPLDAALVEALDETHTEPEPEHNVV